MPTHSGPNPSADNSIVFSYDTGDTSNSYRGEPTVNIAADLGLVSVALSSITYIGIEDGWKKYGLSGTWSSGTYPYAIALNPVTFTGGLPYCVRATVKTNVPDKFNYFGAEGISYVNEPKNYEGTLTSTLNPDGSYTVTRYNFAYTNTTAQAGYLYTNPVNGAVFNPSTDFVYVKEYQAEQKDHPTQFVNGTRSATQGLLPLISNTSLNISTVSFNSNAQIIFDGTDDYINLPTNFQSGYTQATYEFICKSTSLPGSYNYFQLYIQETSTWVALYNVGSGAFFGIDLNNGSGWFDGNGGSTTGAKTTATLTANTYYHIVYSWDGTVVRIYLNGVLQSTTSTLQASNGRQNVTTLGAGDTPRNIGARGGGNYWPGNIDIIKFYNTAISTDQVQQNYRQYKSRFNLS